MLALVFLTLFKSEFSYLSSKITRNSLVEVNTCYYSCISSVQSLINNYSSVIFSAFKTLK